MTDAQLDAALRRIFSAKKAENSQQSDRFRNVIAIGLLAAFLGSMPLLVWQTIPEGNRETITYILGQVSGMATTVVSFYFVNRYGQDALDSQKTANTSAAFRAIEAANKSPASKVEVTNGPGNPVSVESDSGPHPAHGTGGGN